MCGGIVHTSAGESNKDSGGLLRGAVEHKIDRVWSSKCQASRVKGRERNSDPCLSVDPAAEVREARGVQSLPNEPLVHVRRSLVGSILLLSRSMLPQLQPALLASVSSDAAVIRLCANLEVRKATSRAFAASQNKLWTARREVAGYLTAHINIHLVLHKKRCRLYHKCPWPWFVASFADWRWLAINRFSSRSTSRLRHR